MKRCAFILLIGLAAAPAAQAQTCSSHFQPTDSCTEDAFIAKVCDMAAFDPRLFNPAIAGYTSPTCDTSAEWRAHEDLLKETYQLAPPHVQRKLCKFNNFFVLTSRSFTWGSPLPLGIWEHPDRGNKIYIAIPLKVLEEAKKHKSLATQEKEILDRRLDDISYTGARPTFTNGSAMAGTAAAAILAVVAHELGHVLLADNNADGDGGNEPKDAKDKRPCDKPIGSIRNCFKTKFLGSSLWNASRFYQRRWVDVGVRNNNKYLGGIDVEDVKIMLDLQKIYDKRFVSLFAAFSPEEDFVETYKYKVLADVPTLKLTIDLALSKPPDVLDKVRNATGKLKGKINCVTGVTQ